MWSGKGRLVVASSSEALSPPRIGSRIGLSMPFRARPPPPTPPTPALLSPVLDQSSRQQRHHTCFDVLHVYVFSLFAAFLVRVGTFCVYDIGKKTCLSVRSKCVICDFSLACEVFVVFFVCTLASFVSSNMCVLNDMNSYSSIEGLQCLDDTPGQCGVWSPAASCRSFRISWFDFDILVRFLVAPAVSRAAVRTASHSCWCSGACVRATICCTAPQKLFPRFSIHTSTGMTAEQNRENRGIWNFALKS